MMERITRDIRLALRGFARTPSFTVASIAILAIGIGMATAMFTVFDAVLVRKLPVADEARIVELFTYRGDPKTDYYLLREDLRKVAAASRTMRDVGGIAHWGAAEAPMLDGDRALVMQRALVTGNFFAVLGARAERGRLIREEDERPGAAPVVVISQATWLKQFGRDPRVVGRRLVDPYSRHSYEIIGVAPAGLDYPAGVDFWIPAWQPSAQLSVIAVARLRPRATMRDAQSEFFATMSRLFPDRKFDGVRARTFTDAVVGNAQPVIEVLAAAVALLLAIACVNVGNLALLRASGRARELSIRRALGATTGDIAGQLIVESGMLGVAGGVLGSALSFLLIKLLVLNAPRRLPRLDLIGFSGESIVIAIGVTVVAVLLFGVVPALVGSRGQLAVTLRFDSRAGTEARSRRRARQALVASQVALALVMLACASLLLRSLDRLQHIALGYNPEHLAWIEVSFPPSAYNDTAGKFDQSRMYAIGDQLFPRIRAIPGVLALTPVLVPPYFGANIFVGRVDREGDSPEQIKANPFAPVEVGGAEYFKAFGVPIKRGRAFTDADDDRAPGVAIVTETMARKLWPNDNPLGKRIRFWSEDTLAWRTVVGVIGDQHWRSLRESTPSILIPWRQAYWQGSFAIRTSSELSSILPALRRAAHEVNPTYTVWTAKPIDDFLAVPLAEPRLGALLLGGFATVSMLLAAIGLYGVMASLVRGSTRELGVRAALGASPERLRRSVLGQALIVTSAGAIAGLIVALGTSRLLSTLLFEVSPADPISMLGAAVVLLIVALAAAYLPARRATMIDPVEALRVD